MKSKKIREKGKLKFSRIFQELKEGDRVAVKIEQAVKCNLPKRMEGRSGVVEGRRGKAYIVRIKDYDKEKRFIIAPIHLKKLK